jgi:hypothetical protein
LLGTTTVTGCSGSSALAATIRSRNKHSAGRPYGVVCSVIFPMAADPMGAL